jgi:hypothetical protein
MIFYLKMGKNRTKNHQDTLSITQWEPDTLRTYLIRVAGKLLTGNNQLRVRTPADPLYPQEYVLFAENDVDYIDSVQTDHDLLGMIFRDNK